MVYNMPMGLTYFFVSLCVCVCVCVKLEPIICICSVICMQGWPDDARYAARYAAIAVDVIYICVYLYAGYGYGMTPLCVSIV